MIAHFVDFDSDLEFNYDDCDSYEVEMGELYAYTESPEFAENEESFKEFLESKDFQSWKELDEEAQKMLLLDILQTADHGDKIKRNKAIEALLYMAQGIFGECEEVSQQKSNCRTCCFLLYKHGAFNILQELLLMEISNNQQGMSREKQQSAISMEESKQLRHILSIMYTMVETLRREDDDDSDEMKSAQNDFINDLKENLNEKDQSLVVILFSMVSKFCLMSCTNFPIRKVLLLIWKLILACLGGFKLVNSRKAQLRREAGLNVLNEDPIEIVAQMPASNPPTSAADILGMNQAVTRQRRKRMMQTEAEDHSQLNDNSDSNSTMRKGVFEEEKVTSIDDPTSTGGGGDTKPEEEPVTDEGNEENEEDADTTTTAADDDAHDNEEEADDDDDDQQQGPDPGIMTPALPRSGPSVMKTEKIENCIKLETDVGQVAARLFTIRKEQQEETVNKISNVKVPSGLPWIPKACDRDVQAFFNVVRRKFIGYSYNGDMKTVAGLPKPTQESVGVLKSHLYTSLSKLQVEKEVEINRYPFTVGKEEVIADTATERLYQALLLNLPKYMIALLQILLAAAPSTKNKAGDNNSINILADILPGKNQNRQTHVSTVQLGVDVNRHREVIIKSISAIIILLLKHFKLNHVYQFEYTGQHLVFANCIPLILKFLNQGIVGFVTTRNTIPCLEFPECVIGEQTPLSAEKLENMDNEGNSWRNLFSSINLLRILNKLVKWKHSRTMMLVVFKSAPILKNALKVRQAMFQFYVLKLLKTQTKYLGRTWRKSNMKILSDIYQKVRHHLNDDWAFGNDVDTEPWGFQQEEFTLRSNVERFNIRRYRITGHNGNSTHVSYTPSSDEDYLPVNNNLSSLLNQDLELPEDFQQSYSLWMELEVYEQETNWDELLQIPTIG